MVLRQRALRGAPGVDRDAVSSANARSSARRVRPEDAVAGGDQRPLGGEQDLERALDAARVRPRAQLAGAIDLRAAALIALSPRW